MTLETSRRHDSGRYYDQAKWGGFRSFGEFAQSGKCAWVTGFGQPTDERLRPLAAAPEELNQESTGERGGFAVPPGFLDPIMSAVISPTTLAGRCAVLPLARSQVTLPVDGTTPWQATGGLQVAWANEADELLQSAARLGARTLKAHKLIALVPVTDELLDDAPALEAYLRLKVPEKIDYKLSDAILNGSGSGVPLGLLNAPCKIKVSKEGSQTAATFTANNARAMAARMYGPARAGAVWIMATEVFAQVEAFGFPVYTPAGLAGPLPRLLGNEILLHEACAQIGTEGDVVLADLGAYLTIRKAREALSTRLFFDYDTTTFRWVLRFDGQPLLGAPISRPHSTNTASTVVTLEDRS